MGSGTEKISMRTNNKDEEDWERFAGIAIYLAPLCGRKLEQDVRKVQPRHGLEMFSVMANLSLKEDWYD